jgi:hypothetical protein
MSHVDVWFWKCMDASCGPEMHSSKPGMLPHLTTDFCSTYKYPAWLWQKPVNCSFIHSFHLHAFHLYICLRLMFACRCPSNLPSYLCVPPHINSVILHFTMSRDSRRRLDACSSRHSDFVLHATVLSTSVRTWACCTE